MFLSQTELACACLACVLRPGFYHLLSVLPQLSGSHGRRVYKQQVWECEEYVWHLRPEGHKDHVAKPVKGQNSKLVYRGEQSGRILGVGI